MAEKIHEKIHAKLNLKGGGEEMDESETETARRAKSAR